MKREHFVKVVEEALDSLSQEFRSRIVTLLFGRGYAAEPATTAVEAVKTFKTVQF
jgi:hypothetical protein